MKKIFLFLSVILLTSLKAMAAEPYALLSDNNTKLTFYYGTKPANGMSVGPFDFSTGSPRGCEWTREWENITTVVFDASMDNCHSITSTAGWFFSMAYLTTITNLQYLHTENVTDMQYMFAYCRALKNLDMSHFNTAKVTDMKYMFQDCRNLESLNLSTFNTSNVTNMEQMFGHSPSLTSINLSSFNTANVTNMNNMFYHCSSLTSLDLSGFNTGKVTDMSSMFLYCTNLTNLDVSGFNTSSVTNMNGMFAYCSSLKTIYCYDTWNPSSSQGMFYDCTSLVGGDGTHYSANNDNAAYAHPNAGGYFSKKTYALLSDNNTKLTFYYGVKPANGMDVGPFTTHFGPGWNSEAFYITTVVFHASMANCNTITSTAYWFYGMEKLTTVTGIDNLKTANVTDMSHMFHYCRELTSLDVSEFDTGKVTDMSSMFYFCSGLTSLDVSKFKTGSVTDMSCMFKDCNSLTSLDVSKFKTGSVTNMNEMFEGCNSLTSLDLSGFDTGKVTDMSGMFLACRTLTSLDLSGFDTGNVTDMSGMFYFCSGLISLDLSKFKTGSVTNMNNMFYYCYNLTSLDVSGFKTSNVTEMSSMFNNCSSLTSLDVSGFKTSRVTEMSSMFNNCSSLVSLDVSGFDTGNVTNMSSMFYKCSNLTNLDVSGFNTSNVTNMGSMFYGCSSLTSLDVNGFNTVNVTTMNSMFYNCSSLETIYCYNTWNPNTSSKMFTGCTSLVGGTGWHYSADRVTAAYAHPNDGGYFTKKPLPYALLSDNNTKLTFYYDIKPDDGMDVGPFTAASDRGWNGAATTITTVEFDASMANCSTVTSTAYWFYGLENLTTITGIENLNTTNVTTMRSMFSGCKKLKSLDLSSFDTSNVIDMSYMFYFCSSLTSLDVSGFNTSRVVDMSYMFYGCSSLTSLDLSRFNTSRVRYMVSMFYYCSNLTRLDLTSFKTTIVSDMSYMFQGCSNLVSIFCNDTWRATTVSQDMFKNCVRLVGNDGTHYSDSHVTAAYAHPNEGGYFKRTPEPYALLSGSSNDRTLTFYYDIKPTGAMDVGPFNGLSARQWNDRATTITTVVFDATMANCKSITSTAYWFSRFQKLNSIVGLENLKTENVEDMKYMFSECSTSSSSTFESLDLRTFDTQNVKDFQGMFRECSRLSSIDLSSFDTGNATNMLEMFYRCRSLTSLDLTNFNTENVTQMARMFCQCTNLQTIYCNDTWTPTSSQNMFTDCTSLVGGTGTTYNAGRVTAAYAHPNEGGYFTKKQEPYALLSGSSNNRTLTFYYDIKPTGAMDVGPFDGLSARQWNDMAATITTVVFDETMANCKSITSTAYWFSKFQRLSSIVGLNNLNTENVEDMKYMFSECGLSSNSNLESLDLRTFDTRNVKDFHGMFMSSLRLSSIDLSSFDTGNATNMAEMFYRCRSLTSLDLTNFNTENVTQMAGMFYQCTNLQTIYCNDTWVPSTSSTMMFSGCTSLVGGTGTPYNADHVNAAYAHPNEGGYFTGTPPMPYAVLNDDNTKLTFYYGVKPDDGMDVGPFESIDERGWDNIRENITTVEFHISMTDCSTITSTAYWFDGLTNLNTIAHLEYLQTENVTDMRYMFTGCSSLASLDVSGFNTGSVTDMSWMFTSCSGLTSLDLSGFDTGNVTDMSFMFSFCSKLTSLDVSGFVTGNVTNMREMFSRCSSLPTLDLSGFDTGNVTNMSFMFDECSSLTSLDVSGFNTGNVTNLMCMFDECSRLTSLDLTNFNTENVTQMGQMFYQCTNLQTIYCNDTWNSTTPSQDMFSGCTSLVGGTGTPYNADRVTAAFAHPNSGGYFTMNLEPFALLGGSGNNKTLTFYYGAKPDEGMDVVPFVSTGERGWHEERENITTVVFHSSMDACSTITSTAHWFAGLTNLTTIENLEYLHTEDVTDMSYMFSFCSHLTSIDISSFDTEKVKNMEGVFWGCTGLTELDLVSFNTSAVTNMIGMFYNCSNLKTIYCNDTWNSTTPSQAMFYGCNSLVGGTGTTYNSQNVTAAYAHPNAGGYFTKKGLLGDVNSDGKVTPADAIMILYHYFGVAQTGFNESVADVNGDKKISPADAIEALYIYFGSSSGGNARATLPMTVSSRDPE